MKKYLILSIVISFIFACMPPKEPANTTQKEETPQSPINPDLVKGEQLFKQHCSTCHWLDKKLIGPPLKGTKQKYASEQKWLYDYIRDNVKLIKAGDPKAIALYEANGKMPMSVFPFLSDEDIAATLTYTDQ